MIGLLYLHSRLNEGIECVYSKMCAIAVVGEFSGPGEGRAHVT